MKVNQMFYHTATYPQSQLIGNMRWFSLLGYVDINEDPRTGPFPVIVEEPQRNLPNKKFAAPAGSTLVTLGFMIPFINVKGELASLVSTDSATIRLGTSSNATGVPLLTFEGTTLSNEDSLVVTTPNPGALLEAEAFYQLYSSDYIYSSSGTIRILAFLQYAVPMLLPSFEYLVVKQSPIYRSDKNENKNVTTTWFVSSVNGDDSYDGLSVSTPLATFSALLAKPELDNDQIINLERGSTWRQFLDLSANSGMTIQAYGSGKLPRIFADDIRTNWVDSGTANVFQTTVTLAGNAPDAKQQITVYENGDLMSRVADVATCSSTPGSFFCTNTSTAPEGVVTVYLHPTGSTNPILNGNTYEVSSRLYAITSGDRTTLDSIWTRRALSNNGSVAVGNDCNVRNCVFEDGTVHNAFFGTGTVTDCWFYGADTLINLVSTSGTMSICYNTNTSQAATKNITFSGCKYLNKNTTITQVISAFYAHSQDGNKAFGDVVINNCQAYYLGSFAAAQECDSISTYRCLAYQCAAYSSLRSFGGSPIPFSSLEDEIYLSIELSSFSSRIFSGNVDGVDLTIDRMKAYVNEEITSFLRIDDNSITVQKVHITNSIFATGTGRGTCLFIADPVTDLDISFNVFDNWGGFASSTLNLSGISTGINNNAYTENAVWIVNGTTYNSLLAHQTANAELDQNSLEGVTGLLDPVNRNYSISGGVATTLGAGNVSPFQHAANYSALIAEVEAL